MDDPGTLVTDAELRAAWADAGLAAVECRDTVDWVVLSDAETQRVCRAAEHAAGCLVNDWSTNHCPRAIIREESADDRGLRAHEWAHAALECQGMPGGDPNHSMLEVWGADGFVDLFRRGA